MSTVSVTRKEATCTIPGNPRGVKILWGQEGDTYKGKEERDTWKKTHIFLFIALKRSQKDEFIFSFFFVDVSFASMIIEQL